MLAGKRCVTNLEHSLRSTHVTRAHDCMNCLMSTFFFLFSARGGFRLATEIAMEIMDRIPFQQKKRGVEL
jgi:hypothetical protein